MAQSAGANARKGSRSRRCYSLGPYYPVTVKVQDRGKHHVHSGAQQGRFHFSLRYTVVETAAETAAEKCCIFSRLVCSNPIGLRALDGCFSCVFQRLGKSSLGMVYRTVMIVTFWESDPAPLKHRFIGENLRDCCLPLKFTRT